MNKTALPRIFALLAVLILSAGLASGCDKTQSSADSPEEPPMGEEVDLDSLPKVEVPEEGVEFDPSVPVAQLPDGAWTCDMGDLSHYAAMDEKDGKCPVCHMDLQQVKDGKIQE